MGVRNQYLRIVENALYFNCLQKVQTNYTKILKLYIETLKFRECGIKIRFLKIF